MRVGVIDYGGGNLASVLHALRRAGAQPALVSDPHALPDFPGLVLPGVGAFADCMQRLTRLGLPAAIRSAVGDHGVPLLGICVGMQVLAAAGSEHGGCPGLGLLPGTVRQMEPAARLPHIGWNEVAVRADAPLFADLVNPIFYFAHSFAVDLAPGSAHVTASFHHGRDYPAAVASGPVMGVQFHPEKSQQDGLTLLRNFLRCAARINEREGIGSPC